METNNNKQQNSTEEIDLWALFKKVYDVCANGLSSLGIFILRKGLWLIVFLLLGIGYCVYQSMGERKYYSATIQLLSKNINCASIISQIDALGGLLQSGNYTALSSLLNLPDSVLRDIKSVRGLYAVDVNKDKYPDYADVDERVKLNPRDTTIKKMDDYFYLRVEVYSDDAFARVTTSLKEYMRKNKQLLRENEAAVMQKQHLLEEVKKQVAMLDSFQRVDYFERGKTASGQQVVLMNDKEKRLYHYDYISLYKEQQRIENELELYPDIISTTQDFPPLSNPDNTLGLYLKKGVWKFLLLGLICGIVWDYRKTIFSYMFGRRRKRQS